jgi:hypothetical protein
MDALSRYERVIVTMRPSPGDESIDEVVAWERSIRAMGLRLSVDKDGKCVAGARSSRNLVD